MNVSFFSDLLVPIYFDLQSRPKLCSPASSQFVFLVRLHPSSPLGEIDTDVLLILELVSYVSPVSLLAVYNKDHSPNIVFALCV